MSDLTPPKAPPTPTSPKVWVALAVVVGIGVITSLVDVISVDLFAWAGIFAPVLFAGISGGLLFLLSWLKEDKLRSVGAIVSIDHGDDGTPHYGEVIDEGDETVTVLPPNDQLDRNPGPDHRAE